jgi:hypothetical protein
MQKKLWSIGTILAGCAAVLSIISTNMDAGGVPADVHPIGAIGVGVAAIAFLYASKTA